MGREQSRFDVNAVRAELVTSRMRLNERITELRRAIVAENLSRNVTDSEEYAQREAEQGTRAGLIIQLSTEVRAVDEALERLAAGTYRQCVSCEGEIPPLRLKVMPNATRCVPCQEAIEEIVQWRRHHNHALQTRPDVT